MRGGVPALIELIFSAKWFQVMLSQEAEWWEVREGLFEAGPSELRPQWYKRGSCVKCVRRSFLRWENSRDLWGTEKEGAGGAEQVAVRKTEEVGCRGRRAGGRGCGKKVGNCCKRWGGRAHSCQDLFLGSCAAMSLAMCLSRDDGKGKKGLSLGRAGWSGRQPPCWWAWA